MTKIVKLTHFFELAKTVSSSETVVEGVKDCVRISTYIKRSRPIGNVEGWVDW